MNRIINWQISCTCCFWLKSGSGVCFLSMAHEKGFVCLMQTANGIQPLTCCSVVEKYICFIFWQCAEGEKEYDFGKVSGALLPPQALPVVPGPG